MYHSLHVDLARQQHVDVLAEAEHDRLVRSAIREQPGSSGSLGSRLGRIAVGRGRREWQAWQEAFCRLTEVAARSGLPVERNVELAEWVAQQQGRYRNGMLARNRTRLLEALPGWAWEAAVVVPAAILPATELALASWARRLIDHLNSESDYGQTGLVLVVS